MKIDWDAIFGAAVDAGAKAAKDNVPQVKDALSKMQAHHEAAIKSIAKAFASGDIDEDTFRSCMDDEADTLKVELLAISVMSKAIAQRAVNAFRDTLIEGVKEALAAVS